MNISDMVNKTMVTIVGANYVNFTTDDGTHLNFIKLRVLQPMDGSRGDRFGYALSSFNLEPGDKHLKAFQHNDYPLEGELHWKMVSDGKDGSKNVALDFIAKGNPSVDQSKTGTKAHAA